MQAIFVHDMPNISFASGGDTDTLDFVAYVAKDRAGVRSCFVLECGGGLAQDVITTVGQAFELRFKEFLKRPPTGPFLLLLLLLLCSPARARGLLLHVFPAPHAGAAPAQAGGRGVLQRPAGKEASTAAAADRNDQKR